MKDTSRGKCGNAFYVILGIYIIYAAIYIWSTSFVVDGTRYFTLQDDAMISMRYAENIAEGHGPVFNVRGEPVEGFTNPAWVAFMSLLHVLPVPMIKMSLLVQIAGLAFLVLTLFSVRRLSEELAADRPIIALTAVVLTAFYLPLNTWSLQGMEVSVLALLYTHVTYLAVRLVRSGGRVTPVFVLLALAILIRMDTAIFGVLIGVYLLLKLQERRKNILITGIAWGGGFSATDRIAVRVLW